MPRSQPGSKNRNWRGGHGRRRDGYIQVYLGSRPGGSPIYQLEHRLVAERALGRPLKRSEHVHHVNMDKADNRPENLVICTLEYNSWLHREYARRFAAEHFGGGD